MWYFSWILGVALAATFSILNALWLEISPEAVPAIASQRPPEVSHS
jgi:cytochrome bd-I ubiquinol oxidase subunit X